jgi:hypothetical protein
VRFGNIEGDYVGTFLGKGNGSGTALSVGRPRDENRLTGKLHGQLSVISDQLSMVGSH